MYNKFYSGRVENDTILKLNEAKGLKLKGENMTEANEARVEAGKGKSESAELNNSRLKRKLILLTLCKGKALNPAGGSYVLTIPRMWAKLYSWELDGAHWVEMNITGNTITIKPIDEEYALRTMEANRVKPD